MSDFVQHQIKYIFKDEHLIKSALRSAHRDIDGGPSDDGNRGLAYYGICAISMVETHNAIVESGNTLRDFNIRDHWSKTKRGRAKACKALGLESSITQSARQQHQPPSETVLDNAFCATIGAVWLDCEAQDKTAVDTRRTVWNVLQELNKILERSLFTCSDDRVLQSINNDSIRMGESVEKSNLTDLPLREQMGDMGNCDQSWLTRALSDYPTGQLSYEGLTIERQGLSIQDSVGAESSLPPLGCLFDNFGERAITLGAEDVPACAEPATGFEGYFGPLTCFPEALQNVNSNLTTQTTRAKRKRSQDRGENGHSTAYHSMLDSEEYKLGRFSQGERERLSKYLDHPEISKLDKDSTVKFRFLYLALGSWQTIDDFQNEFRLARNSSGIRQLSSTSVWSPVQTYKEICRLEKEEALSVLLRRYHTIILCGNERESHDHCSNMTVETPRTAGAARRSNAGNPVIAIDANLTDQLLYKIMPDAQPGTTEFDRARRKVKRLRKLSKYLYILVQSYGFGILALLPSGPSFEGASLTDNVLLTMTEASFLRFSQLLFREQGPFLKSLSQFVEPSLFALVTCSVESGASCDFETLDISGLREMPKGLVDLRQCLVFEHNF